jgi:hypothetical protein
MFFSGFVCYFVLEFSPNINFFIGALICCLSVHMYSTGRLDKNNIKFKEDLEKNVGSEKKLYLNK